MKIDEILKMIGDLAKENDIGEPFIVGGVPRDRIIGVGGKKNEIKDIDITTGDAGSIRLSQILNKKTEFKYFYI